jgi:hypothetical protein
VESENAMLHASTRDRLSARAALLTIIDARRRETDDPNIGWAIERRILHMELDELTEASRPTFPLRGNLKRVTI